MRAAMMPTRLNRARRPTIDDVARARGRLLGGGVVRRQRPAGRGGGHARADPRRGARARLAPERTGARARPRRARGAIGLLLARPVEQLEVDPFFVRFLAGIERALARTDYALLLRVPEEAPVDARRLRAARRRRARRRLPALRRRGRRPALRAARGGRAAGRGRRPPGRRRARSRRSRPRHADGMAARRRAPGRARARADRVPRRPRRTTSTCRRAWRPGAATLAARRPGAGPGRASATAGPRRSLRRAAPTAIVCAQRRARRRRCSRAARERGLAVPGDLVDHRVRRLAAGRARLAAADERADRLRAVRRGRRGARCWPRSPASRRPFRAGGAAADRARLEAASPDPPPG